MSAARPGDDARDAHLLAALQHAPDRDARPPAALDRRILEMAARAPATPVRTASPRASMAVTWRAWMDALSRPMPAGALGLLLVAGLVTVMWREGPPPGAGPSARNEAIVPPPAQAPPAPAPAVMPVDEATRKPAVKVPDAAATRPESAPAQDRAAPAAVPTLAAPSALPSALPSAAPSSAPSAAPAAAPVAAPSAGPPAQPERSHVAARAAASKVDPASPVVAAPAAEARSADVAVPQRVAESAPSAQTTLGAAAPATRASPQAAGVAPGARPAASAGAALGISPQAAPLLRAQASTAAPAPEPARDAAAADPLPAAIAALTARGSDDPAAVAWRDRLLQLQRRVRGPWMPAPGLPPDAGEAVPDGQGGSLGRLQVDDAQLRWRDARGRTRRAALLPAASTSPQGR